MTVALVGNQNSGKTTLFNLLTGMNAKIGNWPGVTIEKKIGKIKNSKDEIVDLPGIYSLSPYSIEEEVSRKFLFDEKPELIINIVDSTQLERSLYLTTQLLELDTKIIVALNMTDALKKKGIYIDIEKLEERLGTKVIKISALKGSGIDELIKEINSIQIKKVKTIYDVNVENYIDETRNKLPQSLCHKRFVAVKILEADERFKMLETDEIKYNRSILARKYDTDLEEIIATQRYKYIEDTKRYSVMQKLKRTTLSDKLDKILLNKMLALPIFLMVMFLIYYLSVGIVGEYTSNYIFNILKILSDNITEITINNNLSNLIVSMITNGVIPGVGTILSFIPQLVVLFTCVSILETSGYMPRISLILDKFYRKIGLDGKSLIPFIVGSGCSVPAIMSTRIIENHGEREKTAILTPFIPCSAKLTIISLFSRYFFEEHSGIVCASIYFLSVIIIVISALFMKKFIYKNISNTYVSELPEYRMPNVKYLLKDVYDKTSSFIKRAGSVILVSSIIIWFLLSFSFSLEYGINIEESILATIGKKISWIFYPMIGKNSWEAIVSAMQGIIAKEQVISSMSVIAGTAGKNIFECSSFNFFTKSSAYAFIIFNLFSAPCIGAISTMKREIGSFKKVIKVVIYQTVFAWCIATSFYQTCVMIETKSLNILYILIVIIIFTFVNSILKNDNVEMECLGCPYCNSCSKK